MFAKELEERARRQELRRRASINSLTPKKNINTVVDTNVTNTSKKVEEPLDEDSNDVLDLLDSDGGSGQEDEEDDVDADSIFLRMGEKIQTTVMQKKKTSQYSKTILKTRHRRPLANKVTQKVPRVFQNCLKGQSTNPQDHIKTNCFGMSKRCYQRSTAIAREVNYNTIRSSAAVSYRVHS